MTDTLLLDRHPDGVTVLTFNRPHVRNALDLDTMRRFANALSALENDADLRALVITGAGQEAFCSGGDLAELVNYITAEEAHQMITLMGDALLTLERLPVPVIAAINGYALGGGSEIALACDLRIVDENARMGMVQVKQALTPGWGAGQRLLRLVGYARALDILLRGDSLRPPELEALDLVNRVVPAGAALAHAVEYAHEIAQRPPDVVRSMKALLQAGLTQPYDTALHTERSLFPRLWTADAHRQAMSNFLNRPRS